MEVRKGYKQTELGVIPSDWEIKVLRHLVENGSIPSGIFKEQQCYGSGTQIIKLGDVFSNDYYEPSFAQRLQISNKEKLDCSVKIGDIIIALASVKLEGVGKVMFVGKLEELTVYDHNVAIIRASKDIDGKYLFFFLKSNAIRENIRKLSTQVGTTFLKSSSIRALLIALPKNIAEQTAIAIALCDAGALITSLEKLIVKKRNIKQGAMQELLIGKKRLPGFTGKWEEKKLGDVFTLTAGKSKSRYINPGGSYIIMDMGSVSVDGSIIPNKRSNSCADLLNYGDLIMPKDDIGGGNIIGKVAFIGENNKYIMGDHVYRLQTKEGNSQFYSYLINSAYVNRDFRRKAIGSAQLGLNRKSVENQDVIVPNDIEEQAAISQILNDMDTEIESLESKLEKYKLLKQGMMQELLTGKTRLV